MIKNFIQNQVWGLFATPSKYFKIFLVLLPFILSISGYIAYSEYRNSINTNDKVFPTVDRIYSSFIDNFFEANRNIDKKAYREWKENNDKIDNLEEKSFSFKMKNHYLGFKNSILLTDTLSSLKRLFYGMIAAASVALAFSLYMGLFKFIDNLFNSFLTFFGLLQPVAVLPIIMILAGVEDFGKVTFIFVALTASLILSLKSDIQNIPRQNIIKGLTLGASQNQILYKVVLPQIMPKFIDTVRTNLYLGWIFLLSAEMISSENGLGYRVMLFKRTTAMDNIIGYVLWICLLSIVIDAILRYTNKKLYPWYHLSK